MSSLKDCAYERHDNQEQSRHDKGDDSDDGIQRYLPHQTRRDRASTRASMTLVRRLTVFKWTPE